MLKEIKKKFEQSKMGYIKITKKNRSILKSIVSKGGYSWHETYYQNANKYITCLEIHDFMQDSYRGWGKRIINLENVLITMDIEHQYASDYKDQFDGIINKQNNNASDTKKAHRFKKAKENIQDIVRFDNHLKASGDATKLVTLRIYVFDKSLHDLQERVNRVVNRLASMGDMKASVQTNNLREDTKALTSFSNPMKTLLSTSTIAEFMNFSEINRVDKDVALIGYTSNGLVAINTFAFHNFSYNLSLIGGKGSGKSALLKKINQGYVLRGNHVCFIIDIHGEYISYAKKLHIPIVSISANNNINFMEMFFVDNDKGDDVIREPDIENKISCIVATYNDLNKPKREEILSQLSLVLHEEYKRYLGKHLEKLNRSDWLLLEKIQTIVEEKRKTCETEEKQDLYSLSLGLTKMVENLGYLFNRRTNMEFDLTKSVCFDVSFLRNNSDKNVRASYLSLLLNYIGYGVYLHKSRCEELASAMNKYIYELEEPPMTQLLLLDETKTYADNEGFITQLLEIVKYMRKAYSGIATVWHTLKDVQTTKVSEKGEAVRTPIGELFDLTTNTFIGKLDGDSLQKLPDAIPVITKRDANIISKFKKGANGERSFLLKDDSDHKTVFTSIIEPFERTYFGGGA